MREALGWKRDMVGMFWKEKTVGPKAKRRNKKTPPSTPEMGPDILTTAGL